MKRCLAFGAEATRRMKRVADAPMARGDKGPERVAEGTWAGRGKGCWDAEGGRWGARARLMRCCSDFVLAGLCGGATMSARGSGTRYGDVGVPASVERVCEEVQEERWSTEGGAWSGDAFFLDALGRRKTERHEEVGEEECIVDRVAGRKQFCEGPTIKWCASRTRLSQRALGSCDECGGRARPVCTEHASLYTPRFRRTPHARPKRIPAPPPPVPLLRRPPHAAPRPAPARRRPHPLLLDRLRPLDRRLSRRTRRCVSLSLSLLAPVQPRPGTVVATLVSPIGSYFNKSELSSYLGASYLLSVCCFTPLYGDPPDRAPRQSPNAYQVVYQTF